MSVPSSRSGLSVLEAMFALTILAVVLSGVIANVGNLEQASVSSNHMQEADGILRQVVEKIQAVEYVSLNRSGHWSEARFQIDNGNPVEGLTGAELLTLGLLKGPTRVDNVRLFIEYFRGLDDPDGGAGMLQRPGETDADYRDRVTDTALTTTNTFRLNTRADIDNMGSRPLVIRVTIDYWDDDGPRRRSQVTTGRRDE